MFCGLGEEEHIRFKKKKKEKKKKKTSSRPKWLEYKGILKHITREIFFAVLEPFLNETAFYAKLLGGF